jgi:hypothetical protein
MLILIIFLILGNSILRETVQQMNEEGHITKNLIDPPQKDTVTVPDAGFTAIRYPKASSFNKNNSFVSLDC